MPSTADYSFLKPPTSKDHLGTLAHYRVIDELGRGGMGFVFRAEDTKLKRAVALKVMNQKISTTAGSRKRFVTEARSMAAVHHDNVATIFEVGESNGTPFMAMEMLKGETLESLNKREKNLGYETIIKYASQIAHGLAAAHERGIIHRDIKPANIWVEENIDRIKILDFGLALASTPVDPLSGRTAVVGTPGYLSPEQARSDPLDDRSDLYSLGVVLYELCTGQLPLYAKSVPAQLIAILAHRPRPINDINPSIPQPLCDTIHRLIRKEPRSRFQSAKFLEQELTNVAEACEQQSEVALAINRLKEGLDQVTEQAVAPQAAEPSLPFGSLDEISQPVIDPLATPQPTFAPTGTPTVSAGNAARPSQPASSQPSSSVDWRVYGPLIAIVAVLVLGLPIMTYLFATAGRSTEPYVVTAPDSPTQNAASNPVASQNKADLKRQPPAKAPVARKKENVAKSNPPQPKAEPPKAETRQASQSKVAVSTPDSKARASAKSESESPKAPTTSSTTVSSDTQQSIPNSNPSVPDIPAPEPSVPEASARKIPTQIARISTRLGKGADVMVQAGQAENAGAKTSIGVRTRGNVETNHSYLRFDLRSLGGRLKEAQRVELVLRIAASLDTTGANVRAIGIPDAPNWPELAIKWNNSYSVAKSPRPISSFPELASVTLGKNSRLQGDPKTTLRMSDPRLTEFIQKSGDTVTLVLMGQWEERLLRFDSREQSNGEPPRLEIALPL